jgi:hypothetical protein
MSQGKAYTEEQKKQAVESLQSYLELGFSRNKACEMVGLNPSTLSRWIDADETLGMKVKGWENAMNKLAMANLRDAMMKEAEMDDNRKDTSKWWAERKMKDDGFSIRTEQTGKDGAPINFFINPDLANKNGINQGGTDS